MSDLLTTVEALLGADSVLPWEALAAEQQGPIQATLGTAAPPQALAYPRTQEQLAELMACAYQNRWRVLPWGRGSKLAWGGLASGLDLVISTRHLNRLIDHAVGDLTVTAEAGLPLATLQATLGQANQFLALDPAFADRATLGGLVATGDAGSLRQRYGGLRDMLIGLSFVRYDGQIAKAGGRVVKNVAGYDLMKLMTGSYGTLGILSQVTCRTYPGQEASQTVILTGPALPIQQLSQALRLSPLTPVALDVLSPRLVERLGQEKAFGLAARFQSLTAGVEEQVQRLLDLAQALPLTHQVLTGNHDRQLWQQSTATLFAEAAAPLALAKVGLLPEATLSLLELVDALPDAQARLHASSGVGHLRLEGDAVTPNLVQKLRSHCEAASGYLTLLEAPLALKQAVDVWGYSGNALPLMRRLKQQFDPENLLSPGRFVGGL